MSIDILKFAPIPSDWKEDLGKKLREPSINSEYSDWKIEKSFGKEIDLFALAISPGAIGKITVFNDEQDTDKLQNYTENPATLIGAENAMVQYGLTAQLKAATGVIFKDFSFDFDTSQKVSLSYYSLHKNTITLGEALHQNLASFKFIFSHDDITSLQPYEGLAVQYFGSIEGSLQISLSDAYTGVISTIGQLLPHGTGISGDCKLGASLSFYIKIQDEFKAFIRKNSGGNYYVCINKVVKNTNKGAIGLSIKANLIDDEGLNTLFNTLMDALLGAPVQTVDNIINNKLGQLSGQEGEILQSVIKRMGWETSPNDKGLIKQLYEGIKSKVINKIKSIITQKVEMAFSLEYHHIDTKNTIFEANLTPEAIKEGLQHIIMLKPGLIAGLPGVTITKYMLAKDKEIGHKLGFAMQFGSFKAFWYNMNTYKEHVEQSLIDKKQKITFSPQRLHEHKFSNHKKWYLGLNAQMDSAQLMPRMNDFDFELNLHWEDKERKTKKSELQQFVDMAVIWHCIPESNFDKVVDQLTHIALDTLNVKFSCHLRVPMGTMDKLFHSLAYPKTDIIVNSLSEAVPYHDFAFRKSPSIRNFTYNSIWYQYLDKRPQSFKSLAFQCGDYINSFDENLAQWESQFYEKSITMDDGYLSMVGITEHNYIYRILNQFKNGAAYYDMAMDKNKSYSFANMKQAFNDMDEILDAGGANKVFNLNFFARYLFNVALSLGLAEELETVATVEYENHGDGPQTIKYTMSL